MSGCPAVARQTCSRRGQLLVHYLVAGFCSSSPSQMPPAWPMRLLMSALQQPCPSVDSQTSSCTVSEITTAPAYPASNLIAQPPSVLLSWTICHELLLDWHRSIILKGLCKGLAQLNTLFQGLEKTLASLIIIVSQLCTLKFGTACNSHNSTKSAGLEKLWARPEMID